MKDKLQPQGREQAPPGDALAAANARLLALRAAVQASRAPLPPADSETTAVAEPDAAPLRHLADLVAVLPPHLGWGSTAVTAHLRQLSVANDQGATGSEEEKSPTAAPVPVSRETQSEIRNPKSKIPLPPALGLALLQQRRVAEGRLWLLLRAYDRDGRGWWARTEVTAVFTDESSPTCFCTPRYLRQLLARGEGLFWWQDAVGKVWLRGQAKVAAGLGLRRLSGRMVELPTPILLQPIGDLRAHLYAAFHSGRGEDAGPISRESLRDLSGASPRAQQGYEKRAGVRVQSCLAVGGAVGGAAASGAALQEYAWQHGRATFTFHDRRGRHGRMGQEHLARQLPNRYAGPHSTGRRSHRLNRRLAGLCQQGDAGNGPGGGREDDRRADRRRYYTDGAAAAQGWLRGGGQAWVYWPGHRVAAGVMFWYALPKDGRQQA
ncbi:MAG: hypothetical protein IPM39_27830 [Chloroflexi bacterium]|nr:hypothetical protein [Chloroflexota bacterium]